MIVYNKYILCGVPLTITCENEQLLTIVDDDDDDGCIVVSVTRVDK